MKTDINNSQTRGRNIYRQFMNEDVETMTSSKQNLFQSQITKNIMEDI